MAPWFETNRRLFKLERESLAASCPLMMLSRVGPGFPLSPVQATPTECAVVHGTYALSATPAEDDISYGMTLWLPPDYPGTPPFMFCNDPGLPVDTLDRHILANGQACLEVWPEIKRRWPPGSTIVDFLNNLVQPFLAWQTYYDAFGTAPAWGGREHGAEGLINYYAELLSIDRDGNVIGFLNVLAGRPGTNGRLPCPCGSGRRLRNCHRTSVDEARKIVSRDDATVDADLIQRCGK